MTLDERYKEQVIEAARRAIGDNPGMAGPIIRNTMQVLLQTLEGLRELAVEMEEWALEPIVEFPNPLEIRRMALDHMAWKALEALGRNALEVDDEREVSAIYDECASRAAPSLDETIMTVVADYFPSAAILLAEAVTNEEHHGLALKALDELPQEELRDLRQAALSHVAREDDDEGTDGEQQENGEEG